MSKQKLFEFSLVHNIKREIKIQRHLDHPHIIKLYRFFEDKECAYLVLEYASKGSLAAYLKIRRTLPENQAFIFFIQMCLGIDYLHKLNILHRDLKVLKLSSFLCSIYFLPFILPSCSPFPSSRHSLRSIFISLSLLLILLFSLPSLLPPLSLYLIKPPLIKHLLARKPFA